MGIFNLFKKKDKKEMKCINCFKTVDKLTKHEKDGKVYCKNCFDKMMVYKIQTGYAFEDFMREKNSKYIKPKTNFTCLECNRKLDMKYLHKNNICADCYAKNTKSDSLKEDLSNKFIDDITYIKDMRKFKIGHWYQYDVILNARGYGWDTMKEWADYMAENDLEDVSEVTTGSLGLQATNITKSYLKNGKKCKTTPELNEERGILSIAGISKVLNLPIKIVWINQTKVLRFFTVIDNELVMKKYIESVIRRNFNTDDCMKLAKPIPKEENNQKVDLKDYILLLKKYAIEFIPGSLYVLETHRKMLEIIFPVFHINEVMLGPGVQTLLEGYQKRSVYIQEIQTFIAQRVDEWLKIFREEKLTENIKIADVNLLIKCFGVLSVYCHTLKPEYKQNIEKYYNLVAEEIYLRGFIVPTVDDLKPIEYIDNKIMVDSSQFIKWKNQNIGTLQYELCGNLPLNEKEPKIYLYEDGVLTREYVLQTENDEDFTGKYFQISVRLGYLGNAPVPVAQIDGFISNTNENRKFDLGDIGYRFEGHFLSCGGELSGQRYNLTRGQDLVAKGLKYVGYTTPSNVRLLGICPECKKSFCFHGYAFYMIQNEVAYSDDGLDCCQITEYSIDKDNWTYECEGKTFRYYNNFNCPHCNTPYIDYKTNPSNKVFGVSGCVHLGRKVYVQKLDNKTND